MAEILTEEQKQKLLAKKYKKLVETDLYKQIEARGYANDRGDKYAVNVDTLKKLFDAFIIGCTDMEACLNADISPRALYDFQNEFPSLLQLKQVWKHNPILQARNVVLQKIGQAKNAKWLLEHHELSRGEFSKNTNVTLLASDGIFEGEKVDVLEQLLKEIENGKKNPSSNPGSGKANADQGNTTKK